MVHKPNTKPRLHRLEFLFTACTLYYLTPYTADREPLLADERVPEMFAGSPRCTA